MSVIDTQVRIETGPAKTNLGQYSWYQGFNPFVALTTKMLAAAFVLALLLFPQGAGEVLVLLKSTTLRLFGAWYTYLLAAILGLCVIVVLLPVSGRIKLGKPDDTPAFGTPSWLAMMFCSGIGAGILAFSVSEPVSHFTTNPDIISGQITAGSHQAMTSSFKYVFLHWGLSAWSCYALLGLALGLACHRYGHPMTIRSTLVRIFGPRMNGVLGHVIDILAIIAIISGVTTTIVLGIEQICSGLSIITGNSWFADSSGKAPLSTLLITLTVTISIVVLSVMSGMNNGVKWISNIGMILAFIVLGIFVAQGSGAGLVSALLGGTMEYLTTLPGLILNTHAPSALSADTRLADWHGEWTTFYWAWWIAFAPFVGLFIVSISKGRTVRAFILGSVIGPTAMCFLWFSIIGGSALSLELDGTAKGAIVDAAHSFRIYQTVDLMFSPTTALLFKGLLTVLFLILTVSCSTAAIIAIKAIGAAGGTQAETPLHSIVWAVFLAAIAGTVIAVGGIHAVRDVMIVAALPFSLVLALMVVSVIRSLIAAMSETSRSYDVI